VITAASLDGQAPADYPYAAELAFCWKLAQVLKRRREQVRGKPETFTRPDYSFRLERADGDAPPSGDEPVQITPRRRGAPLDLIVAEAMILANSTWGGWLAQLGVPAIYRSQASLLPGIKVRMGAKPLPHAGMGVAQYAWATSPLRRYVDLVNQWQIIAAVRHGRTAALAAPFKPRDAALFSVISAFDAAYSAYNAFQQGIERYWTLRWIEQNAVAELEATVMKEGLVRADALPLVFRVPGTESFARGTRLRARVAGIDLLTLDLHASLVARLDAAAAVSDLAEADAEDAEDAEAAAAPLALAIEVGDEPEAAAESAGDEAASATEPGTADEDPPPR
jgi:exoribonuclease-2